MTEGKISFLDWKGDGWAVFFSQPADALQLTASGPYSTPVDWCPGERAIIANDVSTEEAKERALPGLKVVKPYLRYATPHKG